MVLNINSSEVVKHTARLERIHKSALPSAIRNTLNDAVFDVKTKTMPATANEFKKRSPNFFKANSKFEKAQGFNINSMKATVGFYENKLANAATNYAVKDLEQQEEGGTIKGKTLIPTAKARISNKLVQNKFRLGNIKSNNIVRMAARSKVKGGSSTSVGMKQQFIRAAIYAEQKFGKNALVLGGAAKGGGERLAFIRSITGKRKVSIKVNQTYIYSVKKGRVVHVKATNFMKLASLESARKMDSFYIKQAEKQFAKFNK